METAEMVLIDMDDDDEEMVDNMETPMLTVDKTRMRLTPWHLCPECQGQSSIHQCQCQQSQYDTR